MSLIPLDSEISELARYYVKLIIKDRLNQQIDNVDDIKREEKPDYEKVDINSVTSSDNRTIGTEHIVTSLLKEYHFDKILKDTGFIQKQIDYAKMLITGRLVHPASERDTVRWILENSAISELLQNKEEIYDNALHRTAAMIWENHEKIEKELCGAARDIFGLKETIILYDLTNTYFEGSKRKSKIAKPGRSKERRNDRPIVTLALTVDADGFPKQSRVLEGNVSEPETLKKMLDELSGFTYGPNNQKTIVIDAGIAAEDNIKMIKAKKFKYVAVSRKRAYGDGFWDNCEEKEIKLKDKNTKLKTKLLKTKEEAYLLCHSPFKESKERSILDRKKENFEQALVKINEGLSKKRTQKQYDKIIERIGRLKEKYGVGNLYDIDVKKDKGKASEIIFRKNPNGRAKEERLGEYVLRTNRLDLEDEEISKIHRTLTRVEDCFRNMKSHLGIRPNYHKRDDTGIAHIFISVIGYHIQAGILKKLQNNGIKYNWNSIRNILTSHERVTTTFKTENGTIINIRTCTTPTNKQKKYIKLSI